MIRHDFAGNMLIVGVVAVGVMLVGGCAHKKTAETADHSIFENPLGDSDSGTADGLKTIHFSFDNYTLSPDEKRLLTEDADILKAHDGLKVQIEGHCDQRGGIQYNIALGEKRANAVKHLLVDLGVSGSRLSTVSYGKEHPLDHTETEKAYAKNRRANLVITARN